MYYDINKFKKNELVYLSDKVKWQIIKQNKVNKEILKYLKNILRNLKIFINDNIEGNIFNLINGRYLEGFCVETAKSAILFFDDTDYVYYGYLKLEQGYYFHAWIVFNYDNEKYIFDPCLNIICSKKLMNQLFIINIIDKIPAKKIKDEFNKDIKSISNMNDINKDDNLVIYDEIKNNENILKLKAYFFRKNS